MLRQLLLDTCQYCRCFVHVDQKAWNEFSVLVDEFPETVFISKYSVNWGGLEHLRAIVDLLRCSLKEEYEYAHIISGEDYPVKTGLQFEEFFNNEKISGGDFYGCPLDKRRCKERMVVQILLAIYKV